jgi:hypothetical protein
MPIRSGAMQRPRGCRCGNTLRQRYDEVGLPCSSTMGSLDVRADEPAGCRLPAQTADPTPMAEHPFCRHTPEVGAVCLNWACTVLCGGRSAMSVPTAILAESLQCRRCRPRAGCTEAAVPELTLAISGDLIVLRIGSQGFSRFEVAMFPATMADGAPSLLTSSGGTRHRGVPRCAHRATGRCLMARGAAPPRSARGSTRVWCIFWCRQSGRQGLTGRWIGWVPDVQATPRTFTERSGRSPRQTSQHVTQPSRTRRSRVIKARKGLLAFIRAQHSKHAALAWDRRASK